MTAEHLALLRLGEVRLLRQERPRHPRSSGTTGRSASRSCSRGDRVRVLEQLLRAPHLHLGVSRLADAHHADARARGDEARTRAASSVVSARRAGAVTFSRRPIVRAHVVGPLTASRGRRTRSSSPSSESRAAARQPRRPRAVDDHRVGERLVRRLHMPAARRSRCPCRSGRRRRARGRATSRGRWPRRMAWLGAPPSPAGWVLLLPGGPALGRGGRTRRRGRVPPASIRPSLASGPRSCGRPAAAWAAARARKPPRHVRAESDVRGDGAFLPRC